MLTFIRPFLFCLLAFQAAFPVLAQRLPQGLSAVRSVEGVDEYRLQKDMDLAASIQVVCEEAVLRAGRHAHALTGSKNLVMAGGVALNCVANGRLLREGPFENIWIQPAAGDAGCALGAALLVWHHALGKPRQVNRPDAQKGSLLGPQFGNDDIRVFLDSAGADYEYRPSSGVRFSSPVATSQARITGSLPAVKKCPPSNEKTPPDDHLS
jgi:predicted NodU family carbamoyl transferase